MAGGRADSLTSFNNRQLWHLISATGFLRPKDYVQHELEKSKTKLQNGLSFYKIQRTPQGEALKKDRNLSPAQTEFVVKLSQLLALDEVQSHDLFCAFLFTQFRGSQKELNNILKNERHSQSLLLKIRDFYYGERIYLLRCLRQILLGWMDQNHAYKEVFASFLNQLLENQLLGQKLLHQWNELCQAPLPSKETNGLMMSRVQIMAWALQNLKEQAELLEIMLIYYKDFEMDGPTLLVLCEKFKKHSFGWGQSFKHLVDREMEHLIKRIGYLEVLILLEGFDVLNALEAAKDNSLDSHIILNSADIVQKLSAFISKLGSEPVHGPLLLGWALLQYLQREGSQSETTDPKEKGDSQRRAAARFHQLGNMALQLDVFEFLCGMLDTEPFSGKLQVASITHYVVYSIINALLSIFHEDSLGNPEALHRIAVKLFKWEFIAEAIWDKNNSVGLATLYESSKLAFPLDFACFMQLNISLASAGNGSAQKVKANLQQLTSYLELLDSNRVQDLQNTQEKGVFILKRHKYPFQNSDFMIERNSRGVLINPGTLKSTLCNVGPVIRWQTDYNGWHMMIGEIQELLVQVSHGAGTVRTEQVLKVSLVMELIREVMTSDPASVPVFSEVISLCAQLIVRFAVLSPSPTEMLGHTIQCLALAVPKFPTEVAHHLKQTGLLPFLTENIDNFSEVLSGDGINQGLYGSVLASTECPQGSYSVTTVVLELITQMVMVSLKKGEERTHMASVLFVLRDVFPVFHKWRFVNLMHRKVIGMKCLHLFHKILNFANLNKKEMPSANRGPTLQECCVFSLLFTEAGRALLEIISTGVDSVQHALAQQTSIQEGYGVDLVELIEMSLSLLNRLLLLKHPDLGVSPVENALTSQPAGRQHVHLVSTIAQYVYHRHSRRLPTLATVLLKRLAMGSPMSILACLSNEAEPIREMYLARLQAVSEDITLKVRILELLSVCVDYQPGLIEIFLNVEQQQQEEEKTGKTDSEHNLTLGSSSCLPIVLDLIETRNQCTYRCPPMLLCAALEFIHALWAGMRETPMTVLRKEATFWPSVVAPLKLDLPSLNNGDDVAAQALKLKIKLSSLSLRIAALEIYTTSSNTLDERFSKSLTTVFADSRILYWSKIVKEVMEKTADAEIDNEDNEMSKEPSSLNLLLAWKNFLIACGKFKITQVGLSESTMGNIFHDLLSGVSQQFKANELTEVKVKLASIASALYFTLVKMWGKTISEPAAMVRNLINVVEESCSSCDKLLPSVQIGLLGSIMSILQTSGLKFDNLSQLLDRLLPVLCSVFLQSSRQLTTLMETVLKNQEEDKGSESLSAHIKLQIVSCCLMVEVLRLSPDVPSCLSVIQEQGIVPCVLATTESFLRNRQGISYIYSTLLLLIKMADEENGASMLMMNNLTSHLCLALTSCYASDDMVQQQSGVLAKVYSTLRPNSVTWISLYCLAQNLYSSMLHTLRHAFLEEALNFVGVHQDRMQHALLQARNNLSPASMQEAEVTCNFILQLCAFQRHWRFTLPEVMAKLLGALVSVIQIYSALLVRPGYLMHILEHHKGYEGGSKGEGLLETSAYLQHQTSLDDVEHPSKKLMETQHRMLVLVGKGLAALKHLSPDLPEILLDQSVDVTEWEPVLGLAFTTPSLDGDVTGITFGTLLYLITVCVRHLAKSDTRSVSPHRASPDDVPKAQIPRPVVNFAMEVSLNLLMSQACRYIRDPELAPRDRQFLKRELGTELNSFLSSYHRQLRRGAAMGERSVSVTPPQTASCSSLGGTTTGAAVGTPNLSGNASTPHQLNRSFSQTSFTGAHDPSYIRLAQSFVQNVLR